MLIVLRHFLKRIVGINIGDFKDLSILFNLSEWRNGRRMRVSSPFPLFYEILNIAHHSINNIRYVHFKRIISNLLVSIQE
jgi:hypothetical protein